MTTKPLDYTEFYVVLDAADKLFNNPSATVGWFLTTPIPGFNGQTASELIAAGQAAAVLTHLKMLEEGNYA